MIKTQIEQDLKTALLNGDTFRATVLRGAKSAILYIEVAEGSREQGLSDEQIMQVLQKEVKKRKESIDLYTKTGNLERAKSEQDEVEILQVYLPRQIDESEVMKLVDDAITSLGGLTQQTMGQVIGHVKQAAGSSADGALIAKIVRERL